MYPNSINEGQSPFLLPEIDLPIIDASHFITTSSDTQQNYPTKQLGNRSSQLTRLHNVFIPLLQIKNHGVETCLLDKVLLVFKQFAALPTQEKAKYEREIEGFEGFGSDRLVTQVVVHDWCARFRLTLLPQEKRQLKYWPKHPLDFCTVMDEYSRKLQVLHDSILKAMERSLC